MRVNGDSTHMLAEVYDELWNGIDVGERALHAEAFLRRSPESSVVTLAWDGGESCAVSRFRPGSPLIDRFSSFWLVFS